MDPTNATVTTVTDLRESAVSQTLGPRDSPNTESELNPTKSVKAYWPGRTLVVCKEPVGAAKSDCWTLKPRRRLPPIVSG